MIYDAPLARMLHDVEEPGNRDHSPDTRLANLDAAVSSRGTSTYAGGDTAGTTTLLTRVTALRAGYLDVLAGWTGTLLAAIKALARKDVAANADIAGAHDPATDSEEALADGMPSAANIAAALVGTGFAVVPAAALAPGSLGTYYRATKWVVSPITVGTLPVTRTALWMTIKLSEDDPDSAAIVQISETGGLLWLNGAAVALPILATDATLTYAGTTVAPVVLDQATELVAAHGSYVWDVKYRDGGETVVVATGTISVGQPVTHRIT